MAKPPTRRPWATVPSDAPWWMAPKILRLQRWLWLWLHPRASRLLFVYTQYDDDGDDDDDSSYFVFI